MRLVKRARMFFFASVMSLSLVACGGSEGDDDDDGGGVPGGECYDDPAGCVDSGGQDFQYVADTVTMPQSASSAQQLGLDLDFDPQGRPDNALGQILSTLASQGDLNLQEQVDTAIATGDIILLMNLKASGTGTATDAGAWVYLGANPTPAACTDENDMVCGNHLDGSASFEIASDSPMNAILAGDIIGGEFKGGPGKVTLQLSFGEGEPVTVRLVGAQMEATVSDTGIVMGKLGGAVTEDELQNSVLPSIATVLSTNIADDCTGTPETTCCTEGSTGETLVDLFDDCSAGSTSCDCDIDVDELRNNDLISSLLAPDVDLLDADGDFNPRTDETKDSLSLGIGFTATTASFPAPSL